MDCSMLGSSVHGILQARTLEWVGRLSSRGSSPSRDQTHVSYVSCIGRWVLCHECHTWEAKNPFEKWKWSRSVVSDSLWPHGLYPTRLLPPWDSTGKSTRVGCHFHSQIWNQHLEVKRMTWNTSALLTTDTTRWETAVAMCGHDGPFDVWSDIWGPEPQVLTLLGEYSLLVQDQSVPVRTHQEEGRGMDPVCKVNQKRISIKVVTKYTQFWP